MQGREVVEGCKSPATSHHLRHDQVLNHSWRDYVLGILAHPPATARARLEGRTAAQALVRAPSLTICGLRWCSNGRRNQVRDIDQGTRRRGRHVRASCCSPRQMAWRGLRRGGDTCSGNGLARGRGSVSPHLPVRFAGNGRSVDSVGLRHGRGLPYTTPPRASDLGCKGLARRIQHAGLWVRGRSTGERPADDSCNGCNGCNKGEAAP